MASPAQLVEVMSRATGVPLASVTDYDRRLVAVGLRTKTGRGFNAARMTPLDAARLLTAVLASPQTNQAAEAVLRFSQTSVDPHRSSERLFATASISDLAELGPDHSFVDGLAGLVTSVAIGELKVPGAAAQVERPRIEVTALTKAGIGRIRISGLPSGLTASVEYGPRPGRSVKTAIGDLEQSRRVTEHTVFALASLFEEEPA